MVYSIRLTLNFFFCSFLKHYFLAVRFGLRLQNFVHFSNYSYSGSWFDFSSMILLYCLCPSCQLSAYMSSWVVLWAWPRLLGSQFYIKFNFNNKFTHYFLRIRNWNEFACSLPLLQTNFSHLYLQYFLLTLYRLDKRNYFCSV